jgi:hypothetical protein
MLNRHSSSPASDLCNNYQNYIDQDIEDIVKKEDSSIKITVEQELAAESKMMGMNDN